MTTPISLTTIPLKDKYGIIVQHSGLAFLLTGPAHTIIESNPAARQLFGYTANELLGMSRNKLIHFKAGAPDFESRSVSEKCFVQAEAVGIKKDGEHFDVELSVASFKDNDEIENACIIVTDISKRKKAEAAVAESEQRYKMFVQESSEGIWRVELEEPIHISTSLENMVDACYAFAHIAECNTSFAKMYGFPDSSQIIGQPISQLMPRDNTVNLAFLIKFFTNGFRVTNEISYETDINGNELIFVNNMIGIVEGNYLKRVWGTQRDITEQVKIENALKASEQRYKIFIQQSTEGVWRIEYVNPIPIDLPIEEQLVLFSGNAYIAECNDSMARMYGLEKSEELVGMPLEWILSREQPKNKAQLVALINSGYKLQDSISVEKDKYGNEKFFLNNLLGIIEEGKLKRIWGSQKDITEQKMGEQALAEANLLRNSLISSIDGIVWASNADSVQFDFVSDKAERLLGYPLSQWLKEPNFWANHIHPDDREWATHFSRTETAAKRSHEMEYRMITQDGGVVWIKDIVTVVVENEETVKLRGIMINITERVQLEYSLTQERQMSHQQITDAVITGQEKERSQIGEELHDNINQILATTRLYIECAITDKEERLQMLKESKSLIEKAMQELRQLSKSLLPPSLGEIGILDAIEDLVGDIRQTNKLEIETNWANFDEIKLSPKLKLTIFRIVQEQLNNILKHSQASHAIIGLEKKDDKIILLVKDNGIGFDTTKKRNGVGLKNIISRAEVNNGKVILNTEPGKGCEIWVSFESL